jgi:glycosyltransferase involved in cell wall biosynthesis
MVYRYPQAKKIFHVIIEHLMQKIIRHKLSRLHRTVRRRIKYSRQNPHNRVKEVFDADYYANHSQIAGDIERLVDHFLVEGWKNRFNPHPLFSVDYYLKQSPDVDEIGINPLLHYLNWGVFELRNPHPLFDISFYLAQTPGLLKRDQNPLIHYLNYGANQGFNPHPLFDTSYYLQKYPDVRAAGMNPLSHFLRFGYQEGYTPHPLFDTDFYKKTYLPKSNENPLLHYVANPSNEPNPWFNTKRYLEHIPSIVSEGINPLVHLLYEKIHAGQYRNLSAQHFSESTTANLSNQSPKPLLYIVSHEASRTGAPAIILNIARFFYNLGLYDLVIFMHRGGPLLEEFQKLGAIVNFEYFSEAHLTSGAADNLVESYIKYNPVMVIVNSSESHYFVEMFGKTKIPVLTLVHEFLTYYKEDIVLKILKNSQKIIFPSEYIKNVALSKFDINEGEYTVISQGLLSSEFGQMDVSTARKLVREEFQLPSDAFIVLCCGSGPIRKGFDLFIQVAASYFRSFPSSDVYFLWVGKSDDNPEFIHFMEHDIGRLGLKNNFLCAGEIEKVEPFFVGSDVFFLSSREDPFPCVVHEAMAARLPIIVFEDSGGAPESIANTGITVPYADFEVAANELFKLYINPDLRERLGEMAQRRVRNEYNFQRYCYLIIKFIQEKMEIDLNIKIPEFTKSQTIKSRQPSPQERFKYYDCYKLREKIKYDKNKKVDPIFIAGTTRSGTSIMKLALRMVYESVDANEGHLWPLYKEIWDTVEKYLKKHQTNLSHPNSLALTGRESLRHGIFNMFHDIHMGGNNGKVFIDKSPSVHLITSLPHLQSLYPDMRVIYMIRHGVNNIESKIRKFPDVKFEQHCENWMQSVEAWFQVKGSIKTFLEIDQAVLKLKPKKIVDEVQSFLGLDGRERAVLLDTFSGRVIEQTSKSTEVNTLLANTDWDDLQKEAFNEICGATMKKCNYVY